MSRSLRCRLLRILLLSLGCVLTATPGSAQNFRISTRIYDHSQATDDIKAPVISRSLTLFHAGKIYDYLDSVGEVIVLEPAHDRVTVLNTKRHVATTVHFDEIKRLLKVRESETEKYLDELLAENTPQADAASRMLRFQLQPEFQPRFDSDRDLLQLSSPVIEYQVRCAAHESDELIDSYLQYADWVARLNSILHSQSLFPEPRLQLNQLLREHRRIPIEVTLHAELESQLHLRAQHDFVWALDAVDRRLINHWESILRNDNLERTTLVDYQRKMLLSAAGRD